ncbi:MAG: radical SAM family heme chaperone HemW [Proteobacteria bacterium]|nr:radical SAM family heme chaperone HemW [Pseudomonadota bacterium]MBU1687874.1 radical SAM family heme chaperone HemW [Pseudomonadota bacterium]
MSARPEAGLYLHIPFCRSKCDYCAFVSYPLGRHDLTDYCTALAKEIKKVSTLDWSRNHRFSTIFIGGGTPTIVEAASLVHLLDLLRSHFWVDDQAEITVETNPNTVHSEALSHLREGGVNRLSIGVQTFDDAILTRIGRTHTAAQAITAATQARESGFENINLDLIFGLPGQTLSDWQATLTQAINLAPDHLSIYQLSLDQGSRFSELADQGALTLPDEEEEAEMFEFTNLVLPPNGFERYEISNYSRLGRQCRHNLNYWDNGSYLGFGAGSVSCLSGLRLQTTPNPDRYTKCITQDLPPYIEAESLAPEARFRETVIMGLRLITGIDGNLLRERFGLDLREYYGTILENLIHQDLLRFDHNRLYLTERALPIANQVLAELV